MRILLTHGYFLAEDALEQKINKPYPPLGLLYLSAYLKANGFTPEVYDSTFATPAALQRHILRTHPDLVGIYVNMMTRKFVLPLLAVCADTKAKVVVGGPEPANYAAQYLHAGADVVVVGEGEHTLLELVRQLDAGAWDLAGIDGIAYADATGKTVTNPPREKIKHLDELPFPDRAAIDTPRYLDVWKTHHGASSISLITARGCPYTCRWCSHSVYGFSYRTRSPENVADEIAQIKRVYDPDQLWYADDVFTINPKWIKRFAAELTRRDLHTPFETISREDRIDDAVVADLVTMRCSRLWVGAESGSQAVLDAMDRRTSAARTRLVIDKLKRNGIKAGTFIMFGYEGEGWNELNETYAHLTQSLPDDLLTTTAYPIKGTPFYEEVADRVIAKESWAGSSDRDLSIRGSKSSLFYWLTGKWMHAGVRLRREQHAAHPRVRTIVRAWLTMAASRVAMYAMWPLEARRS